MYNFSISSQSLPFEYYVPQVPVCQGSAMQAVVLSSPSIINFSSVVDVAHSFFAQPPLLAAPLPKSRDFYEGIVRGINGTERYISPEAVFDPHVVAWTACGGVPPSSLSQRSSDFYRGAVRGAQIAREHILRWDMIRDPHAIACAECGGAPSVIPSQKSDNYCNGFELGARETVLQASQGCYINPPIIAQQVCERMSLTTEFQVYYDFYYGAVEGSEEAYSQLVQGHFVDPHALAQEACGRVSVPHDMAHVSLFAPVPQRYTRVTLSPVFAEQGSERAGSPLSVREAFEEEEISDEEPLNIESIAVMEGEEPMWIPQFHTDPAEADKIYTSKDLNDLLRESVQSSLFLTQKVQNIFTYVNRYFCEQYRQGILPDQCIASMYSEYATNMVFYEDLLRASALYFAFLGKSKYLFQILDGKIKYPNLVCIKILSLALLPFKRDFDSASILDPNFSVNLASREFICKRLICDYKTNPTTIISKASVLSVVFANCLEKIFVIMIGDESTRALVKEEFTMGLDKTDASQRTSLLCKKIPFHVLFARYTTSDFHVPSTRWVRHFKQLHMPREDFVRILSSSNHGKTLIQVCIDAVNYVLKKSGQGEETIKKLIKWVKVLCQEPGVVQPGDAQYINAIYEADCARKVKNEAFHVVLRKAYEEMQSIISTALDSQDARGVVRNLPRDV